MQCLKKWTIMPFFFHLLKDYIHDDNYAFFFHLLKDYIHDDLFPSLEIML